MDSNWIHDPSGQNSGTAPKMVLEIGTVLMIVDDSDFRWTYDYCQWKGYLLSFSCICRTFKREVVCNLDVNLNRRWSWTPSWTQTRQFRIGLVRHLLVHVSLALQHLLDAPFVLHGPLLES
jgi:hypothetical protein